MGLEDADFGDYVMNGMMTAGRRMCSSFMCHCGSHRCWDFLPCERFIPIDNIMSWHHRVQKCQRFCMGRSRAGSVNQHLPPLVRSRTAKGTERLQPRAPETSLAGRGQAGPSANLMSPA